MSSFRKQWYSFTLWENHSAPHPPHVDAALLQAFPDKEQKVLGILDMYQITTLLLLNQLGVEGYLFKINILKYWAPFRERYFYVFNKIVH